MKKVQGVLSIYLYRAQMFLMEGLHRDIRQAKPSRSISLVHH